jgi:hypothetical protein
VQNGPFGNFGAASGNTGVPYQADCIVERPDVNGTYTPLANFGSVAFTRKALRAI